MTQVLSVTSECAPLVKTGGLADVTGALPEAMASQGARLRTVLPGYPAVMAALDDGATEVMTEADLFGGSARVLAGKGAGLDLLVVDAPHLFDREGAIYLGPDGQDWPDNPARFAGLSWMAARIADEGVAGWRPDVVHMHDWQAGLAALYLRQMGTHVGTLITVHNIAFQGLFSPDLMAGLKIGAEAYTAEGVEYYGNVSALKAGLVYADRISTVSPTYARELLTPEFGMGLDGVLQARAGDLSGILNGIDTLAWDPSTDRSIKFRYKTPRGKGRNIRALRRELGLPDSEGPLCVVISRLTGQKGLDVLAEATPALIEAGGQLAVLGSGDPALEDAFRGLAESNENISATIGYDEPMSHRMIAGADAILIPSRFEPCGLTQLYGLRYGTLPLVARTGGLSDTVTGLRAGNDGLETATGFVFAPVERTALEASLRHLCEVFEDQPAWTRMQRNALQSPVGWDASAPAYAALYAEITKAP